MKRIPITKLKVGEQRIFWYGLHKFQSAIVLGFPTQFHVEVKWVTKHGSAVTRFNREWFENHTV